MLFEYHRKNSKEEIILTDGRNKAEADAKMREWSLSWSC